MLCTQCSLTGADEAFKKVSAAYACLSDADKRRSYDTWGTEDRSQMGGFQGFRGGGGDVDAEELFRAFFAQAGRPGGGAGAHFFNFGAAGAGGGRGGLISCHWFVAWSHHHNINIHNLFCCYRS